MVSQLDSRPQEGYGWATVYRGRNGVERRINKLKQWRSIATRYEKRALNYRALVVLAALMIWRTC